jgi:hypothetical protein
MFGMRKVELAYRIFDVLRRADCEYVPASVIERVHDVNIGYLYEVLSILCKNGVLASRRGAHGGYKHVREVSLYSLMAWFSPAGTPNAKDYDDPILAQHMARLTHQLRQTIVKPRKLVPLDYNIGEAEVYATASKDVHEAKDGLPLSQQPQNERNQDVSTRQEEWRGNTDR